jgi:signal peptidase
MAASAEAAVRPRRVLAPLSPRVVKRALHALFVVALAVAALALATVVVPRAFGFGTLAVMSGSMGGSAPTGSLVIGSWHAPEQIEVGDVILVRRDGRIPVLHRVIARESRAGEAVVRLKGDANPAADPEPYTLPDRVLRKRWALPVIGYVVGILRVPAAWMVFVVVPTILLAFLILRDLWRRPELPDAEEAPAAPARAEAEAAAPDLAQRLAAHDRSLRDRELALADQEAELATRAAALDEREAALHSLEQQLEARSAAEEPAAAPTPTGPHLLFVPGPGGYRLVEGTGPPPAVDEVVESDGVRYAVTRVAASPLPSDQRRCAYLCTL